MSQLFRSKLTIPRI